VDNFYVSLETSTNIPPEIRFWAHCSNLETWGENNYDTRLIHSNLAFPLLKKLTEAGDQTKKNYHSNSQDQIVDFYYFNS
jgi:hypothetical protein